MNFKTILGVCAIGIVAFGSCKKSSSSGPTSPIDGKWKLTQNGFDLNSNDTLDASEITADSTGEVDVYNSNGTGSIAGSLGGIAYSGPFTWSLTDSNKWLKQTFSNQTTYYHVDALTATSMTLRDTTGGFINWTIYTKQ